ncbi:MAG TPA: terminase TerL endonuclease subunit, partial [Pirellulales bacterium]
PRPRAPATPRRPAAGVRAAQGDAPILPRDGRALRKLLCLLPGYDPYADAGDCRFERDAAEKPLRFVRKYIKDAKGRPLDLQPWQVALIANLFGWIRKDGTRRYREAFVYVPRKNGKTTLLAALVLYVLLCDGEPEPEIYSAASTHDQAKLLLKAAKAMIRKEPALSRQLRIFRDTIVRTAVGKRAEAAYKALAADADAAHGLNPHLLVLDELHAQKNREFVDALTTANGARDQPLTIYITTADFSRPSLCNEKLKYAKQVRDGIRSDRTLLPAIYAAEIEDDHADPKVWARANPNLDVSIKSEYLREQCAKAAASLAATNAFKRLHLNIQTGAASAWLKLETWDDCPPLDLADLRQRPCYGGLDLALTTDLSAFVLVFPPRTEFETWACVPRFWVPGEHARERSHRDKVPYLEWARDGLIEMTEGDVTDFDAIRRGINAAREEFPALVEIGFDPWRSQQLIQQLGECDGFSLLEVRQNFGAMSSPTKELERLIRSKQLAHAGHPVLRWMAGNVVTISDKNENVRPSKGKSTEKIDGIVALIMALARAQLRPVAAPKPSVYETRGVRSL